MKSEFENWPLAVLKLKMPERKLHDVVSLDQGRVQIQNETGTIHVIKLTEEREVSNLLLLQQTIRTADRLRWGEGLFEVKLPQLISWDSGKGVLEMEYIEGENLEEILKSTLGKEREGYVELAKEFISWMERNGIFWGAAAPRHLIINSNDKSIGIVDFERSVILEDGPFPHEEFKFLIRSNVCQEFSAFLFQDEQLQVFPDIWLETKHKNISLKSIHGSRLNLLLSKFFGPIDDQVSSEQLMFSQKFMSSIVTPFLHDGIPFYPLVHISKHVRRAQEYVDLTLELSKLDRVLWPEYFGNFGK